MQGKQLRKALSGVTSSWHIFLYLQQSPDDPPQNGSDTAMPLSAPYDFAGHPNNHNNHNNHHNNHQSGGGHSGLDWIKLSRACINKSNISKLGQEPTAKDIIYNWFYL